MREIKLHDGWKMRQVGTEEYIAAIVPGSVYGDLLAAGKMEDPFWKDNETAALTLMDEDYEYRLLFVCEADLLASDEVILRFEGLDTVADVVLNGKRLGHVENMHRTWEFSVKEVLRETENELKVTFYSPTRHIAKAYRNAPTRGTEDAMDGFVHLRKAHCMFGWDWGAHLPDAGIWRAVSLLGVEKARIDSVEVLQQHEDGRVRLLLKPELRFAGAYDRLETGGSLRSGTGEKEGLLSEAVPLYKEERRTLTGQMMAEGTRGMSEGTGLQLTYTLTAPDGSQTEQKENTFTIENPQLWWPSGYGGQPLYTVTACLTDTRTGRELDVWERRIGLRTITMDRTKDRWGERFATCVNGVDIFAMGADYIPEDHLLGRVTRETTKRLLEKAVFANFNSIRVWGGGYYPDDWFYDLCDEMGLVVWQDFMFACGVYDLTPEFEENIRAEFIDNLKRIRHHASLGLMCGNNEMEQFVKERNWVTKDSEVRDYIIMYERILPQIMQEYAPQVFYWPASPSSGGSFDNPQDENRGDVHYWDVWHGNKPFSEYRKFYFRYLSEFGFQSFPAKKTVETFTDDTRDMNIFSYIMERHQRNGAANGKIMHYMQQTFRYPSDFDTVLYASQLLQAEAIRCGVEHFRRNRNDGRCMGAVYWQLNDCWPVASWSSVDYCGRLKALHYAARRFFAPILISCEEEGMMTSGQELVRLPFAFPKSIRLNVANETMQEIGVTVKWQLRDARARVLRSEETEITVPALQTVWLDRVALDDVDIYTQYVSYQAYMDGGVVSEGTVIFSYPKYFRYKDPQLTCKVEGNRITVSAKAYAKSVEILNENEDLLLTDNYFDLNADSKTVEVLSGEINTLRLRSVYNIE